MRYFFLVILFFTSSLRAEFGGGYAGAPFRYGTNARGNALAGAMAAEPNFGFLTFSNPAIGVETTKHQFGFSYFHMSLDRSIQVVNYSRFLPPKGALSVAWFRSGTDQIIGRDLSGEKTDKMSVSDSYGMVSFSMGFNPRFSAGLNLRALFSDIADELTATGITVDLGIFHKMNKKLFLGAMVSGVGGKISWSQDGGGEEEKIPMISSGAFSYRHSPKLKILGQIDGVLIPDHGTEGRVRLATEYYWQERLFLRAGMNHTSLTAGFGMQLSVWKLEKIQFDYSLDMGRHGEGISHLFTWAVLL